MAIFATCTGNIANPLMRKFIILLFSILYGSSLFAQYNYAGKWPSRFRIGGEGGVSLISFFGNVINEKTHIGTLGFNSGLFLQYSFNQILHPDSTSKTTVHFGLKSGIYFDRKGAITTPASLANAGLPPGKTTIHTHMDYLTLPVLVQFTMGRENKVKVYQLLGPYVSVLVNQNTIRRTPDSTTVSSNDLSAYKKIDIGLSIGLGVEIPIQQKFYINAELRQNVGLFNINQTAFPNHVIVQTSSTCLMVGFSYRFTRNKAPKEKQ